MTAEAWPEATVSVLYPWLLHAHRALVGLSVAIFTARGVGVALQASWPLALASRWASVVVDVFLMGAGVSLWVLMAHHPWREPWLMAKLLCLLAYIVLGSYALKRGRTRRTRTLFFLAALLCVSWMYAMARTRSPWGWLA